MNVLVCGDVKPRYLCLEMHLTEMQKDWSHGFLSTAIDHAYKGGRWPLAYDTNKNHQRCVQAGDNAIYLMS